MKSEMEKIEEFLNLYNSLTLVNTKKMRVPYQNYSVIDASEMCEEDTCQKYAIVDEESDWISVVLTYEEFLNFFLKEIIKGSFKLGQQDVRLDIKKILHIEV